MAAVEHVVLDSGAFLRNAKVQEIGKKIYTVPDVVGEIKDKATKQRLQVLPFELIFREPSSEALKFVTDFSKKTGDYGSLSAVDMRVMALTYQLEKEMVGTDHIRTEPDRKIEWNASGRPLEKATDIAGFYVKPSKVFSSRTTSECSSVNQENVDPRTNKEDTELATSEVSGENGVENDAKNWEKSSDVVADEDSKMQGFSKDRECTERTGSSKIEDSVMTSQTNKESRIKKIEETQEGEIVTNEMLGEESDEDESEEDDDEDDGEGGWITPGNIKSMKQKMEGDGLERADIKVGCLTTDFSMQNVLIQMGLNVVSVDGMLIKQAKSFVLRCFACFKITSSVEKQFCPHCGNKTLTKVSMTVNDDGSIKYFLSKRRPVNIRGTKYKLPMPKGGKHAANPQLVEDQPQAQNRISNKARSKVDVFDPDYITRNSPFAVNDVTSRAAQLGIKSQKGKTHYWERRNPNAVKKNRRK